MSTQSAETLKALLSLSKANMDVPLSEVYAVMRNSLLIDLMGCSGSNLSLKNDSFNWRGDNDDVPVYMSILQPEIPSFRPLQLLPGLLARMGPDEIEDDEDILQEDDPSEEGDDFEDADEIEDD